MKIPPFLLGAALVFWGIETDRLIISVLLTFIVESHQFVRHRYNLDEAAFVKISDLTSLIFLAAITLILLNAEAQYFLKIITGWAPLIFSPLIVAQLYSTGDTIIIGTRLGRSSKFHAHRPLDYRVYYFCTCLFAAATGNSRSIWFWLLLCALVGYLIYTNRGRAHSKTSHFFIFSIGIVVGYGVLMCFEMSHSYVMQKSWGYLHRYYRNQYADPYKTHVNFGEMGQLKFSGKIIMRVSGSNDIPSYFKEATYDTYYQGKWFSTQGKYEFLARDENSNWELIQPPHPEGKNYLVELDLPREKGLLPYPQGGYLLESKTIFEVEKHKNGGVKIVDGAPVVSYSLYYDNLMISGADVPGNRNVELPEEEKYALTKVVDELALANQSSEAKIEGVRNYFQKDFSYSLQFLGKGEYDSPLGNFLLQKKSGFCEYYATATALLLRQLGVPSRYAVGYVVNERSRLEDKYIVRDRHAHAWAEAWLDGGWVRVDTTPSIWLEADAQNSSSFESIKDLLNLLSHKYKMFQVGGKEDYTFILSVVVVVLTGGLILRIYLRLRIKKTEEKDEKQRRSFQRVETPFTPIVDYLTSLGVRRTSGESFSRWAMRCRRWRQFNEEEFEVLYRKHLELRFDPSCKSAEVKPALEKGVKEYVLEIFGEET